MELLNIVTILIKPKQLNCKNLQVLCNDFSFYALKTRKTITSFYINNSRGVVKEV